jgi:hypothetical protein
MSDLDNLQFPSDEDLPEREHKVPPAGTKAVAQVRPSKEGVLGDFRTGESGFGPWMIVDFEVIEGEYAGTWAGTIISVDPTDRRFRAIFTAATGVDISAGGNVTFKDFKEKLISGVFEVEIGPEKRKNKGTGQYEETGYTAVTKILSRLRDRDPEELAAGAAGDEEEAIAASAPAGDDDIPF